ncbi:metallophosphoesterase [Bosea beijingensis]
MTVVYAVADLHGRLDLLEAMEEAIGADITSIGAEKLMICNLGDYIDRGPRSAQVLERLSSISSGRTHRVFLKGNHEDRMISSSQSPTSSAWDG